MTETSGPAPRGAGSGILRAPAGGGDHAAVFASFARCLAGMIAARPAAGGSRRHRARRFP